MTIQSHQLANGFRIITENMPNLESATIGIWVNVGGRHESAEQNGIAHFLEHMAFKGTSRRSALQIAEEIENVGGYLNAYTSCEVTAYYARILQNDVPLALDLLADILLNPLFDPQELEIERGVILQEIGQALDTPDEVVFDWLQEKAYPNHPLGRPILGPAENVRRFDRKDLLDFVKAFYTPANMVLSVAGAVDHEKIVAQATALFSDMPQYSIPTPAVATFIGGEHRENKDLEQAHFTMAFECCGYKDPAIHTAQIYAGILGGGMSSRLFQELREKRGLCYTVFSQISAHEETGMINFYAGTGAEHIHDLTCVMMDEILRASKDITEIELHRTRTQMKSRMLMGQESPSARAERMARHLAIWGRVLSLDEVAQKIDAVTLEDVRQFGTDFLSRKNGAFVFYGPVAQAPSVEDLMQRIPS